MSVQVASRKLQVSGQALRCEQCGLPFGRIQNGVLVVESRHHGQVHMNVISLATIQKLLQEVSPDETDRIN
jgi:hypothetical protein